MERDEESHQQQGHKDDEKKRGEIAEHTCGGCFINNLGSLKGTLERTCQTHLRNLPGLRGSKAK